MQIPFLDYRRLYTHYQDEMDAAIKATLLTGKLILQSDVEEFEKEFAKFLGVRHVVGLNSGTDAIHMALLAAGVGPGDEVITSAHTFKSTVGAILKTGADAVTVGIDERGLMDLDAMEKKINKRTKAIIPVHLAGDVIDMVELKKRTYAIPIIEDACQGIGASWGGQMAGTFGFAGAFSHYPAKTLGAYGDAGSLATNDAELAQEIKDMRNHYKDSNLDFGVNSRLDNLQAAVLIVKLRHLKQDIEARAKVAAVYDQELAGLPLGLPKQREGRTYQDYIIRTPWRNELHDYLAKYGVQTLKNEYPFHFDYEKPESAKKYEAETLRIPCNPYLTDDEVRQIVLEIKSFYAGM